MVASYPDGRATTSCPHPRLGPQSCGILVCPFSTRTQGPQALEPPCAPAGCLPSPRLALGSLPCTYPPSPPRLLDMLLSMPPAVQETLIGDDANSAVKLTAPLSRCSLGPGAGTRHVRL